MGSFRVFISLALLALAVRLAAGAVLGLSRPPRGDEAGYLAIARSLAAGDGFRLRVERTGREGPVALTLRSLRPPLYPALLAPFSGSVPAGRILSMVFGSVAAGLLWLWGRRAGAGPGAPVAALLLAFWPSHVWFSGELLTEALTVLLLLAHVLALQGGRPLAAGAALGLAILARPAGAVLLLPALLAVGAMEAFRGRRARAAAWLLLPALLLPGTWAARNAAIHGRILLTTNLGVTLLGGNSEASRTAERPGRWHPPGEALRGLPDPPDLGFYGWSGLAEEANDRRFTRLALEWIREDPARFLRHAGSKVLRFFDPDQHSDDPDAPLKRLAGWLSFGLLLPAMAAGAILAARRWRVHLPALGLLGGHLAVAAAFYGDARMRLPAVPALLLFAGIALVGAARRLSRRAFRGAGPGRPSA